MVRDEIVGYLDDYARSFDVPLYEGVAATRLRGTPDGGFELDHDSRPADRRPGRGRHRARTRCRCGRRMAERLPDVVHQLHSSEYRNPESLPPGGVLVVGTGQSGCQIAEDLHLAGRRVHLAVGSAPRVARTLPRPGRGRVAGRTWATTARGIDEFADADAVRFRANHYVTGRDGGRDIDLRAFAWDGMRLYGRLTGIDGTMLTLRRRPGAATWTTPTRSPRASRTRSTSGSSGAASTAPTEPRYTPVWRPNAPPTELDLAAEGISTVVWGTGFGRDHRWIEVPVFDGRGYPTHDRGVTSCPGLYFLGLPWQYTWGSGRFCGVAVGRRAPGRSDRRNPGVQAAAEVSWIAGTRYSTWPTDDEWVGTDGRWREGEHDPTARARRAPAPRRAAGLPVLRRPAGQPGHRRAGDHRANCSPTWTPRAPSGRW